MVASVLRLAVAVIILFLLARSGRAAWRNRSLATTVWRRIRPRHVLGSVALLAVVLGVASLLMWAIPATSIGLGSIIGLGGNAVFAPVEEAAARAGAGASVSAGGITAEQLVTIGTVGFLLLLLVMFPWLAYVEERVFREGLERAPLTREVLAALRFGLSHLVMLIPVAAALAIAVAGFFYGRVYRRAFARAAADELTPIERARTDGVLASTVWHTTFNSLIVVTFLVLVVLDGL